MVPSCTLGSGACGAGGVSGTGSGSVVVVGTSVVLVVLLVDAAVVVSAVVLVTVAADDPCPSLHAVNNRRAAVAATNP